MATDMTQQEFNEMLQTAISQGLFGYYTSAYSNEEMDRAIGMILGDRPGGPVGKNLLDNWYFVGGGTSGKFPINQRGQTSYPGLGYAIDRWRIPGDGGTLTVNQNGITYQNTTENTAYLSQFLELSRLIPGRQHTMSALFAEGSAAKAAEFVCYRPGSPGYSVFTGNAVEGVGLSSVTFTVPEDTTSLEARLITGPYGTTGDFTAIAAKLEPGSRQTLAYKDESGALRLYEIPVYAEELLKCQYYYVKDAVQVITNSASAAVIQLPRKMRVNPTCTVDVGTFSSATLSTIFVNGISANTGAIINYTASAEL